MTEISSWLLKHISKKWSIQYEFSFLQKACFQRISLNDKYFYDNSHMSEDQKNEL